MLKYVKIRQVKKVFKETEVTKHFSVELHI
jgi:hypothetical protein